MPPRRGKSAAKSTDVGDASAMDVDAASSSNQALGDVALELASARNALRDALESSDEFRPREASAGEYVAPRRRRGSFLRLARA